MTEPSVNNVQKLLQLDTEHVFCCKAGNRCEDFKRAMSSQQAAEIALKAIHERSFSARHPELGKMIKCVHCGLRHRENERKCEQKFATGRYDLRDPKPLLIAGKTPETAVTPPHTELKIIVGARQFKGKRRRPPLNKRANQFVQLVRDLLPFEYTKEDLEKARAKAKRILVKKHGRHGFMPPVWQSRKEANAKKSSS